MDTYTYQIGNNLYINLTNRCSNRCAFCVRDQSDEYEGHFLRLKNEPTAAQVIAQIGDPKRYKEIVFCGYGEPTYRMAELLEIARDVRENGGKTRLNTNGHGSLINGREIAPELTLLDGVNISLNAPNEAAYVALCRPAYRGAFGAALSFARACKENGVNCWFSVVDCIGDRQVRECKELAKEVGIPLRVREMIG